MYEIIFFIRYNFVWIILTKVEMNQVERFTKNSTYGYEPARTVGPCRTRSDRNYCDTTLSGRDIRLRGGGVNV